MKESNQKQLIQVLQEKAAQEINTLVVAAIKNLRQNRCDFGNVEKMVRENVLQLGSNILTTSLTIYGTGYRGSRIKCSCGHKKKYVGNRKKKLSTLVKEIELTRAYYFCKHCGESFFPLDNELRIMGTGKSPGVREAVCLVGVEESFGSSRKILQAVGGLDISKSKIRVIAEKVGTVIECQNKSEVEKYYWEKRQSAIPQANLPQPEYLYISADGTCVNTLHGWKEVKSGAVFDAKLDKKKPVRITTTYVGGFEEAQDFTNRLYTESYKRGVDNAKEKLALGDGAKWIWNSVDLNYPDAVRIVDYYHATERIWELGKMLSFANNEQAKMFVKPYLKNLNCGQAGKIITQLQSLKTDSQEIRNKIQEAIVYYENNRDKMNYKKYKQRGYFIGSGVVEGSCKHLVGERLKKSGMRWSIPGGNSMLQLRICFRNNNWNAFWQHYNHLC